VFALHNAPITRLFFLVIHQPSHSALESEASIKVSPGYLLAMEDCVMGMVREKNWWWECRNWRRAGGGVAMGYNPFWTELPTTIDLAPAVLSRGQLSTIRKGRAVVAGGIMVTWTLDQLVFSMRN